jgi:tRNA(Arg) A34 adenosine deaminase TadA
MPCLDSPLKKQKFQSRKEGVFFCSRDQRFEKSHPYRRNGNVGKASAVLQRTIKPVAKAVHWPVGHFPQVPSSIEWTAEEPAMPDKTIASRLLEVMEKDILPMTQLGVSEGNKVFGAAILRKSDLALVLAETNNELENPLWHGEVHTLKRFYELTDKPPTTELIFLSTHEPCTMCMSAITWAGFDNFYYFFSHEDSRDSFAIPHDLKILKEVFGLEPGGYRRQNAFWKSFAIADLVETEDEARKSELTAQAARIRARYDALSTIYQASKDANAIPLN